LGTVPSLGPLGVHGGAEGYRFSYTEERMTKQQLIESVATKTGQGKREVEAVVDSAFGTIAETLQANGRIDLRGFGSFVVKDKKGRQGRNPRSGETITIAAKRSASFKPGKELTEKFGQVPAAEPAPLA
jgi:integration host factor subunit beta